MKDLFSKRQNFSHYTLNFLFTFKRSVFFPSKYTKVMGGGLQAPPHHHHPQGGGVCVAGPPPPLPPSPRPPPLPSLPSPVIPGVEGLRPVYNDRPFSAADIDRIKARALPQAGPPVRGDQPSSQRGASQPAALLFIPRTPLPSLTSI